MAWDKGVGTVLSSLECLLCLFSLLLWGGGCFVTDKAAAPLVFNTSSCTAITLLATLFRSQKPPRLLPRVTQVELTRSMVRTQASLVRKFLKLMFSEYYKIVSAWDSGKGSESHSICW